MQKHKNVKKQGNKTQPKVNNSQIPDSNNSEVDEMPTKEFKIILTRLINKFKDNMNKLLN
jgi:hypothetical protein